MTSRETNKGRSTVGRPRHLTDAQVTAILDWHKNRKSFKQVARDYGISVATLQYVIRTNGQYKQCAPEQRGPTKAQRRARIAELKARYLL